MSVAVIRKLLETALDAALTITIAYENATFQPIAGVPYARAFLLMAEPDNPEIGPGFVERGLFQANLFYPKGGGSAAATAAAELVRAAFAYGSSLTGSGVTVNIIATPEIGPGFVERGLFQANLFYPKGGGSAAATAAAELVRAAFAYGSSLTGSGVTVNIIATPEIGPARAEDDRFLVPVKIRFHAWIGS